MILSALHVASLNGHALCVKALLENGSHIDALDAYGCSSLHLAASQSHINCIQEVGKKINTRLGRE